MKKKLYYFMILLLMACSQDQIIPTVKPTLFGDVRTYFENNGFPIQSLTNDQLKEKEAINGFSIKVGSAEAQDQFKGLDLILQRYSSKLMITPTTVKAFTSSGKTCQTEWSFYTWANGCSDGMVCSTCDSSDGSWQCKYLFIYCPPQK